MKIHFQNVGRGKKSWTASIAGLHHDHLYTEVKSAHVLRSNDVSFDIAEDARTGTIYAGMHSVGTFTFEADGAELN